MRACPIFMKTDMDANRLRQLWQKRAVSHGNADYLISADEQLSYAAYSRRIRHFAQAISNGKLGTYRVPLATDIQDPLKLSILIGACIEGDVSLAFVPDCRLPSTMRSILDEIGAMTLVTDRGEMLGHDWVSGFDQLNERAPTEDFVQSSYLDTTEHGFFVLQTSGTEGEPRWVACRYKHCLAAIQGMESSGALEHARNQVVYLTPPLFHSYGLSSLLEYTYCGSTIVLPGADSAFGPISDLLRNKARAQITAIEGVPYFYAQLRKLISRLKLPALSHIGVGAGAVQYELVACTSEHWTGLSFGIRYGLTETPSAVTHKVFRAAQQEWSNSCGKVTGAYEIQIVSAEGDPLPAGQEGEIIVSGDCVSTYLGTSGTGVHATGDLGFLDGHGELHVIGRKSVFIKNRGFRISPERVETEVIRLPGISDCRVLMRDGQLVAEIVELQRGLTDADLIRHLVDNLPGYCVPDCVARVDEVPRTRSGKIVRH